MVTVSGYQEKETLSEYTTYRPHWLCWYHEDHPVLCFWSAEHHWRDLQPSTLQSRLSYASHRQTCWPDSMSSFFLLTSSPFAPVKQTENAYLLCSSHLLWIQGSHIELPSWKLHSLFISTATKTSFLMQSSPMYTTTWSLKWFPIFPS